MCNRGRNGYEKRKNWNSAEKGSDTRSKGTQRYGKRETWRGTEGSNYDKVEFPKLSRTLYGAEKEIRNSHEEQETDKEK